MLSSPVTYNISNMYILICMSMKEQENLTMHVVYSTKFSQFGSEKALRKKAIIPIYFVI